MIMPDEKNSRKSKFVVKMSVPEYQKLIEDFLKNENKPYSEHHIREKLFDIQINEGIPSSAEELLISLRLKEALKSLIKEQKVAGSLTEDPITKEQVMYYFTSGHYAGPDG
jgi:hypothetical protein